MEEAGADTLELNIYFLLTEPDINGQEIEEHYLKLKVSKQLNKHKMVYEKR